MPQMNNITVKKADGTTDITYTAQQPSGGDKSPAIWRSNTVGTSVAARPELRVISRPNGTGTARRVDLSFTYPYTVVGSDGKTVVADRFNFTGSGVAPAGMPDDDVAEAAYQVLNLAASPLLKQSFASGFAPA